MQRQATDVDCKCMVTGGLRAPTPALPGPVRVAGLQGPLQEASELQETFEWGASPHTPRPPGAPAGSQTLRSVPEYPKLISAISATLLVQIDLNVLKYDQTESLLDLLTSRSQDPFYVAKRFKRTLLVQMKPLRNQVTNSLFAHIPCGALRGY